MAWLFLDCNGTVQATQGVMEMAHNRKKTHGVSVAEEIQRLDIMVEALSAVKDKLNVSPAS